MQSQAKHEVGEVAEAPSESYKGAMPEASNERKGESGRVVLLFVSESRRNVVG